MMSLIRISYAAALAIGLAVGVFHMPDWAQAASSKASVDTVTVEGGKVKGVATDISGVQVFKGIPFAGPTSGDNRFRAPQPVVPWEGVKLADQWGDQALQDIHTNPVGAFWGDEFYFDPAFLPKASENGLNLNVWTPAKSAGDKLPVYVWIHGGANHHGYASEMEFYASKLAAKGIVVVSVQYRVGALGFLALKELSDESPQHVSGNYATLDLVKALHWVKDNIAGFGGDPSKVTIGGQSAGARNTTMLLRTPLAKGLFRRAVIESGSSGFMPVPMMDLKEREAVDAKAMETVFGKPTSLADLRAIPADTIVTQTMSDGKTLLYDALHGAINKTSQYTLDGYVFTKDSIDLLKPDALNGHDIMIGGTSDEYTSLEGGPDKTLAPEDFAKAIQTIGYDDAWKEVYRPSNDQDAYRLWLRARADYNLQNFIVSAEYAKAHNKDFNVYTFYFNHAPPGRNSEFYGSFHSSDLWYFFNSMRDVPGQRKWTGADYRMADTMSSYLVNFVKTGNPNGDGLPRWQQTTVSDKGAFMRFRDGYAYPVTQTPYPERDALNRQTALRKAKLTEAALAR
ncbi:carboxylesterase/lipase family protein [Rhizobium rhizogenes]|uniref:carboxylesterase/lipase family protein n=1 Tax=Rhizobium rhizogenes TaxID=359 RepID=UPI00157315C4|nr:carboxylesterase family protein [Rhizobium rhizogenes]NTF90887.1 carboxylesterase family protein [Rhizobium rhizogenes]